MRPASFRLRRPRAALATIVLIPFAATLVVGALSAPAAGAWSSERVSYFQGFEQNTSGWCDLKGMPCDGALGDSGPITRVPSGSSTGSTGYANRVEASSGNYYARVSGGANNASPGGCVFYGSGATANPSPCQGPYTDFGLGTTDYKFPQPGFVTQIDIYLDTTYAQRTPPPVVAGQQNIGDYRFDVETAINSSSSFYLQGYDFNVGTGGGTTGEPAGTFVIQASNNADRTGAYPENPCSPLSTTCVAPLVVSTSGWYTFRWDFQDVSGTLVPTMEVLDHSGNELASWTATKDEQPISGVGGPSLLWLPNEEIPGLPIDNASLNANGNVKCGGNYHRHFYQQHGCWWSHS